MNCVHFSSGTDFTCSSDVFIAGPRDVIQIPEQVNQLFNDDNDIQRVIILHKNRNTGKSDGSCLIYTKM